MARYEDEHRTKPKKLKQQHPIREGLRPVLCGIPFGFRYFGIAPNLYKSNEKFRTKEIAMVTVETYYAAVAFASGVGVLFGMYVGFWIGARRK